MTYYQNIIETANYIIKYFGEQIDYAVVLGSGITLEFGRSTRTWLRGYSTFSRK